MPILTGKRAQAARVLEQTGLGRLLRERRPWDGVVGLAYHRIGPGTGGLLSATEEEFDATISVLARDTDVVGPADLLAAASAGHGRYVVVSFDDGYRDNYEKAFPILRAHGVTGTFFVTTGLIDRRVAAWWEEIAWMVGDSSLGGLPADEWLTTPIPFDRPDRSVAVRALEARYKELPGDRTAAFLDHLADRLGTCRRPPPADDGLWMTWDMLREMHAGGMVIGGHTDTHPVLACLAPERQEAEVGACGRRLAEELGEPMRSFSYPNGLRCSFDAASRNALRRHETPIAFSSYGSHSTFSGWDPFDVRRAVVAAGMTPAEVTAMSSLPRWFSH